MSATKDGIIEVGMQQLQRITDDNPYLITPVMDLKVAKQRLKEFQEFVREYLVDGEDFGVIPGTGKPTLFKPGADKLCEIYGLADSYEIVQQEENYDTGLFSYTMKCNLTKKGSGTFVASGLGSCTSFESKYRWRKGERKCPSCGAAAIIKGREEYGGGWLCFGKKGGCGSKFLDSDPKIVNQTTERVLNQDINDSRNTILKMTLKRAKVSAVLSATRSSGVFTQDMEDVEPETIGSEGHRPAASQGQPQAQKTATATTQAPAQAAPKERAKAPATRQKAPVPAAKTSPTPAAAAQPAQAAPPAEKPAESTLPKAQIPPAPPNGKPKTLKDWARDLASRVQCSPDQLVIFMKRIISKGMGQEITDFKNGVPEGQKIVVLNALERISKMTWPTGMNAVTSFVRNEGLTPDFKAVELAFADLLVTESDQPPTA